MQGTASGKYAERARQRDACLETIVKVVDLTIGERGQQVESVRGATVIALGGRTYIASSIQSKYVLPLSYGVNYCPFILIRPMILSQGLRLASDWSEVDPPHGRSRR